MRPESRAGGVGPGGDAPRKGLGSRNIASGNAVPSDIAGVDPAPRGRVATVRPLPPPSWWRATQAHAAFGSVPGCLNPFTVCPLPPQRPASSPASASGGVPDCLSPPLSYLNSGHSGTRYRRTGFGFLTPSVSIAQLFVIAPAKAVRQQYWSAGRRRRLTAAGACAVSTSQAMRVTHDRRADDSRGEPQGPARPAEHAVASRGGSHDA